jgi:hypothetical protein
MAGEFNQFDSSVPEVLENVKMFAHPDLPKSVGVVVLSFTSYQVFVWVDDQAGWRRPRSLRSAISQSDLHELSE